MKITSIQDRLATKAVETFDKKHTKLDQRLEKKPGQAEQIKKQDNRLHQKLDKNLDKILGEGHNHLDSVELSPTPHLHPKLTRGQGSAPLNLAPSGNSTAITITTDPTAPSVESEVELADQQAAIITASPNEALSTQGNIVNKASLLLNGE